MELRSDPRQTSVGELRRLTLTVPQVAHLLNIDTDQIRRAIDRRMITATLVRQNNRQIRTLDGIDILFLRMKHVLHHGIRRELYQQIKLAPDLSKLDNVLQTSAMDRTDDTLNGIFNVIHRLADVTVHDIGSLNEVSRYVDKKGWISGANVEAHRIAALVSGGMTVTDVLDDYPNLTNAQVDAAVSYAQANPKPGRPYPSRTAKSVLRTGGGGLAAAFADAREAEPST